MTGPPSRPALPELLLVAGCVAASAIWLVLGVAGAVEARSDRAEQVAKLERGEESSLSRGEQFAARDQLVTVNLARVREFLEDPAGFEPVNLLDAVESLTESKSAMAGAETRKALGRLLAALDGIEEEEGFLDPDLEAARDLARETLAEEKE